MSGPQGPFSYRFPEIYPPSFANNPRGAEGSVLLVPEPFILGLFQSGLRRNRRIDSGMNVDGVDGALGFPRGESDPEDHPLRPSQSHWWDISGALLRRGGGMAKMALRCDLTLVGPHSCHYV